MKGRLSPELEDILRTPEGRNQLRDSLIDGKGGDVRVDRVTYRIKTGNVAGRANPAPAGRGEGETIRRSAG